MRSIIGLFGRPTLLLKQFKSMMNHPNLILHMIFVLQITFTPLLNERLRFLTSNALRILLSFVIALETFIRIHQLQTGNFRLFSKWIKQCPLLFFPQSSLALFDVGKIKVFLSLDDLLSIFSSVGDFASPINLPTKINEWEDLLVRYVI